MSKTSVIVHPARTPIVMMRADYFAICDHNQAAATLLNTFEYWTNKFANNPEDECWIFRSRGDLQADTFNLFGLNKIDSAIAFLIEKGFLSRRNNPEKKNDRMMQYKLEIKNVQKAINDTFPDLQFHALELKHPCFNIKASMLYFQSNDTIEGIESNIDSLEAVEPPVDLSPPKTPIEDPSGDEEETEPTPTPEEGDNLAAAPEDKRTADQLERPWLYDSHPVSDEQYTELRVTDKNTALRMVILWHLRTREDVPDPLSHPFKGSREQTMAAHIRKIVDDVTPIKLKHAIDGYSKDNEHAHTLTNQSTFVTRYLENVDKPKPGAPQDNLPPWQRAQSIGDE